MHHSRNPQRSRRGALLALATAAHVLLATTFAVAAELPFPHKPIRLVAAQQPGSATDNVARLVAEALESQLGVAVAVDNRPGAGGKIGAENAANATPDGYTLLLGGQSNLVLAPVTDPDLRYDPVRDFVPVGRVARVPFAFAVSGDLPVRTLRELVALAKEKPGKLTYASLGPGTQSGFIMELLRAETGAELLVVEYKGITTAMTDVLAGRIDVAFNEIAAIAQHVASGRMRMLAVAEPKRVARAPDVPTTAEAGYPRLLLSSWYGVVAPAATPPEVVRRLVEAHEAAMRTPGLRARIAALGYEPIDDAPGQFAGVLRDDVARLRAIASRSAKAR